MREFFVHLAGVTLPCSARYDDTIEYFRAFGTVLPTVPRTASPAGPEELPPAVRIPDRDWADYLAEGMEACAHTEYSALTPYFSDALLASDRVILHAVAVRWRDWAYLICAESGTGKTTQAQVLQELRPGEFSVICGDRPVLQFFPTIAGSRYSAKEPAAQPRGVSGDFPPQGRVFLPGTDGAFGGRIVSLDFTGAAEREEPAAPGPGGGFHTPPILVHPSPWNGKENWHGAEAAPLAGVILLERGEKNALCSLTENEAAMPVYAQFIHTAAGAESIHRIAGLETRLLRAVPAWKLVTHQVPDSTRLLLEAVFS